jgi:oligopeptide transport system permease protein
LLDQDPKSDQEALLEDGEAKLEEALGAGAGGVSTAAGAAGAAAVAVEGGVSEYQASLWGDAWRQLRRNPLFLIAAALLLVFTVMAVAPWLFTSQSPNLNENPGFCDLSRTVGRPQSGAWFGYDILGCDYYTKVIYGTRVSLTIGLLVVGVDVMIAIVLGSIAGFFGGFWDGVIGRMADIWFALPTTLAGIVFLSVMGERGLLQVSFVLIFLGWPTLMRLMRSSVLSGKETDYVLAARALGAGNWRILRAHILPNGIAPVIVYGTISVGIIISAEAALSFLGVGLQLPAISWGLMISAAQNRILQSPHLLLFPAVFLSVLVLCFIIIGDALRDALDPRLR